MTVFGVPYLRLAANLPGLTARKGRRGFFKLTAEEKMASELSKLNRQLKAKDKHIKRLERAKESSKLHRENLEHQKKQFVKKIKTDPQVKDSLSVHEEKNLIL